MIRLPLFAALAVNLGGVKIDYSPFTSNVYPYHIDQPSSYSHIVISDESGHRIDYFAPGLGSFVTNVNIYATGGHVEDEVAVMRATGGHQVHVSGSVIIMGKHCAVVSGLWRGFTGRWYEDRIEFSAANLLWHITMSYEVRFASTRAVMLHMVRTFHTR